MWIRSNLCRWAGVVGLQLGLLCLIPSSSARGATDVWLFYGWGPNGWSSGIDQIASKVRQLRNVSSVHVYDYKETQRAYDEARATPADHPLAFVGYSCGGNATLAVGGALANNNRAAHVIALQPSIWCGQYPTTSNMRYFQDTWSASTGGLGSYQPEGPPAHYTAFVERPNPHGAADTDPVYQRDAVLAVNAVANPSRRYLLQRHLYATAHVVRQDAAVIWFQEGGGGPPPSRPPPSCPGCVIGGGPINPPPPVRPERPPLDCRWAWTSERGWIVACGRPPASRHARARH